jgi:hypothetical protein
MVGNLKVDNKYFMKVLFHKLTILHPRIPGSYKSSSLVVPLQFYGEHIDRKSPDSQDDNCCGKEGKSVATVYIMIHPCVGKLLRPPSIGTIHC